MNARVSTLRSGAWFPAAILMIAAAVSGCVTPQARVPTVDSVAAQREAQKQRELVVRSFAESRSRLLDTGYRVLTSGAPLCGEKIAGMLGAQFHSVDTYGEDWKLAARQTFGLGDEAVVSHVVAESPAAAAGLEIGDVVASIEDWPVPPGEGAVEAVTEKLDVVLARQRTFTMGLTRAGQYRRLSISPKLGCDFDLVLTAGEERNAYADGKRLYLTRGMMDFIRSDTELAMIVSHELAHNSMGHSSAQTTNTVIGGVVGLVLDIAAAAAGINTQGTFTDLGARVGQTAYSVGFEQEADYVGIYFMALAGYELDNAPLLWRRMAVMDPRSIKLATTHPTAPARFVALENAIQEVKLKIARDAPLVPEMKPEDAAPGPDASDAAAN